MTEEDPFVHEQPISSEKKIIYFLQFYQESGSNNASVTVIMSGDKSQNTTLADNVYRDETVVAYFEVRGWVKFSVDQLDALSFIKSILESFNADFDNVSSTGKSFKKCIEVAERGSSIILTAQKVDITEIADCTFFLDQILGKLILPPDPIISGSEGHEDATVTRKETDSLIEGLAPEPESPLTGANLATNSDGVIEALRAADHQEASDNDAEALGVADHQEVSDNDAEALRAADNQEASTAEILGVVDDQSEDSSDQDTFDFFSSLETLKVSHAFQLKELPQKLHSLRILDATFRSR
ncbi:hypothetical protein L6164_023379 [Bauhinia variegata]|uniref:Uncharacterized protein n=1 Tax=Bauhinia variegata TaxID=167791 RepID=A0ACB9MI60_BAUVA|nr:hypothetical protein L6164_023379 [Bauhinia variegata]